ncbi:MAG: Uma2 family endonuclease [Anaerolineae bacterium]|nr:Uma2 family endonuclease [Anaerolineae bacterium]MDQ7033509.1 Uma2 family endonuclease [Anaerolineae bacterium]
MSAEKKPTEKRPITLNGVFEISSVDAYKKIEVVDGDWSQADVHFYRGHGMLSGVIHGNLLYCFSAFMKENPIGRAYAGSVGFVMEGNRDNIQLMRRTDVSFVLKEHVPTENRDEPYYRAPDLAVEVVYRDFADDMFQRIDDFLSHGTEQVWVVAPSPKIIWVYAQDGTAKAYRSGDTLSGGDLLPSFELDIAKVFET